MSKTVIQLAWRACLRPSAKAVLNAMAWFADDTGQSIWPSVNTLAQNTGYSRRAIQKLLRELEEAGVIRALGSRLGGKHKTTHYCIDLAWLEQNALRANPVRPSAPVNSAGNGQKGEPEAPETANGQTQNGELRSSEEKEHEYEKNLEPSPRRARETKKASPSYENQRLLQSIRKESRRFSMPSRLSVEASQDRRLELRRQAELLSKRPQTASQPDFGHGTGWNGVVSDGGSI